MYREANKDTEYREPVHQTGQSDTQRPAASTGDASSQPGTNEAPGHRVDLGAKAKGTLSRLSFKLPASNAQRIIALAIAIALMAGAGFGLDWLISGRYMISTDDAYVRAHNTTLASKISGYVASIPIEDNTQVHAGDVIASIDDGDYRLAADAAREKVATQQATVDRIGEQIVAQKANVDQTKAQMASAQAMATKTQLELARQQALAAQKYASEQTLEQAQAERDQAAAAVQSAQAVIDAAAATLDVLKAQQQEAARTLDELRTAQAKAERDLSFTVIRAPVDGVFSNRAVQTGDYVQTGQHVASLVPLSGVYIEANFKETQLGRIRPGQSVSISVDALPQHAIKGVVASLSPASGSVFSLLPPDNATRNFTKIVQRLPVRIEVPAGVADQRVLRPGMSVVVTVNTRPGHEVQAGLTSAADAAESIPDLRQSE